MKWLLETNRIMCCSLFFLAALVSCKNEIKKEYIIVEETSRVDYLPYFEDESFTPHWLIPGSTQEKEFHKIPDFKLVNQLGETVTEKTFDNKIYITDFFFTSCPGICPKMTGNMVKVQEAFKDNEAVLLLSHSVTPTLDSVSVLKKYAKNNQVINGKWHLVTGNKNEIYSLGRNAYFVENNLGEIRTIDDFLHTENFLLIDENKHIRGIYNGLNRASIAQLITDVKSLLKASDI